jgi:hypothetical protein
MEFMKLAEPNVTVASPREAKVPGKPAIIRAVASSTAIETGQSISEIERTLRARNSKFRHITLAR